MQQTETTRAEQVFIVPAQNIKSFLSIRTILQTAK